MTTPNPPAPSEAVAKVRSVFEEFASCTECGGVDNATADWCSCCGNSGMVPEALEALDAVTRLESALAEAKGRIAELEAQLAAKTDYIAQLTAHIRRLEDG